MKCCYCLRVPSASTTEQYIGFGIHAPGSLSPNTCEYISINLFLHETVARSYKLKVILFSFAIPVFYSLAILQYLIIKRL